MLAALARGETSVPQALEQLRELPFTDLGFAKVDHHRALRLGYPEVVLGQGKTPAQVVSVAESLYLKGARVLVTRASSEQADAMRERFTATRHDAVARTIVLEHEPLDPRGRGPICVVTAGTSDIPVAQEAVVTAQTLGNEVTRLFDVGVAGIHRLFAHRAELEQASVIIVVAGMEGALASVIGGLIARPIIAVPTSIGYGASLQGLAALLGMLNSCASGVSVVNIDNGFGAACAAHRINQQQA